MESNPYEPPKSKSLSQPPAAANRIEGTGTFAIDVCLRDAWRATISNFPALLGVMVVGGVLSFVSAITFIGYFLVIPVLMWGVVQVYLDAHDSSARFGTLFSGFSRYGARLGRMLGLGIMLFLITLPGSAVSYYGIFTDDFSLQMIGTAISIVYGLAITIRFYLSGLFAVDLDEGVVESLSSSWRCTGTNWLKLVLLALVAVALVMLGAVALLIGMLVTVPMSYLLFVSAYRQIVGGPARSVEGA